MSIRFQERFYKLAEQAWDDTAVSPDFGHPVTFAEKFADLIFEDIITVVAAQALSNHSALDVFNNLRRIYCDEEDAKST